jgi:hypothetical protein
VVLKNRLEQFKKRQRDDALKATESGHRSTLEKQVTFGGDMQADMGEDAEAGEDADDEVDEDDWVEEYEPEMSPEPVEIRDMTLDDRRLPVIEEEDHIRAIVSCAPSYSKYVQPLTRVVRRPARPRSVQPFGRWSGQPRPDAHDQVRLAPICSGSRSGAPRPRRGAARGRSAHGRIGGGVRRPGGRARTRCAAGRAPRLVGQVSAQKTQILQPGPNGL